MRDTHAHATPRVHSDIHNCCLVLPLSSRLAPVGSLFSICMTSVVNLVLTEVTLSTDISATYALAVFLFLFAALLGRDITLFRAGRNKELNQAGGGGGGLSVNSFSPSSLLNPDDNATSEAILNSFERQQRLGGGSGSPLSGKTSSERLIGISSPGSHGDLYASHASHRLFSSLTSVRGRLLVPILFVAISLLAVLLCLLVLAPDWTSHYPVSVRTVFYTLLATSLLFTLAYLFITFWRLVKILGAALLCAGFCPWRGAGGSSSGSGASGQSRFNYRPRDDGDVGSPDLFESLSHFASTSLVRSVAQVRIMAVCAAISGVYFGHMFGALDSQDQTKRYAQERGKAEIAMRQNSMRK